MRCIRTKIVLPGLLGIWLPAFADVVPDGGTATTVATDGDGHATVSIAPKVDNISHNTYQRFDVDAAGVTLDNLTVAARTIVNEVTSAELSRLNGTLEVLGTPAHVIIANPNGIQVDGARFVNTGALALATGAVDIRPDSRGGGYSNVFVTTTGGRITVGEGGLSGTMTQLDLIAREIALNGPVTLDSTSAGAELDIHAGSSESEFDNAVFASNLAVDWNEGRITGLGASSEGEVLVDITRGASLNASRIQVVVNDQGAGVNIAGEALAGRGAFRLSSTGEVVLDNGRVRAAGDAVLDVGDLTVSSDAAVEEQATIDAGGGLLVRAGGDIRNTGGRLQGNTRIESEADSAGGVTLLAGGDIVNRTVDADRLGIVFSRDDNLAVRAGGDVVNDTARLIANAAVDIRADGAFHNRVEVPDFAGRGRLFETERKGKRLWFSMFLKKEKIHTRSVDFGELPNAGELAFVVADGDVDIDAGEVFNIGGEINANDGDIRITTSRLDNRAVQSGSAFLESRCSFGCDKHGYSTVELHGGQLQASGGITIEATDAVHNTGGRFLAFDDIRIASPEVAANALDVYEVVQRPKGLRGLFMQDEALLLRMDQGGSFISNMGRIDFDTVIPVRLDGGTTEAADGVESTGGIDVVREPEKDSSRFREHQGLFHRVL